MRNNLQLLGSKQCVLLMIRLVNLGPSCNHWMKKMGNRILNDIAVEF